MAPRESIYAALFALLSALTAGGSPAFKKASRVLESPDQVQSEEMPALYQLQKDEDTTLVREIPTKWDMNVEVYIYVSTQAPVGGTAPSQILNPLVDAVVGALQPLTQGQPFEQTLGGLVSKCRVSGKVVYGEGVAGNYAVAIVPVRITVPA